MPMMPDRRLSAYGEQRLDFSTVDGRLSALSMEERATDYHVEGDLSEVSTIAFDQDEYNHDRNVIDDSELDMADMSGWTTQVNTSPTPTLPAPQPGLHVQNDNQVMQVKKETKMRWSKYPMKGYTVTTKYFYEEIDSHWTAALVVICFFISGIVDSVSLQTFGVFTSLQTGNTILMALRLSNQPANRYPFAYVKSMVSVGGYCLGALFFNILHRVPTGISNTRPLLHRWTLFATFVLQSILLIISAALAQSGWVSTRPSLSGMFSSGSERLAPSEDNYLDLLPVCLLAFEAAGQVCLSRVLIINELPTIVISTLYHDFIADALSWRQLWRKRRSNWEFIEGQKRQIRRISSIIALFSGAVVGGFVYASPGGLAAALWIAAGSKCIVSLAWCLWKKKVVTDTVVEKDPVPAPVKPA